MLIIAEKLTAISLQPKEKPLRTKRGHRKPSFLTNLEGPSFASQGPGGAATLSPSGSDAFRTQPDASNARTSTANRQLSSISNGDVANTHVDTPPPAKPRNAFDIYCRDLRDILILQNREAFNEGTWHPDQALAFGWRNMDDAQRASFQIRYEHVKNAEREGKPDDDVEMVDGGDETGAAVETGGFTAVNRE